MDQAYVYEFCGREQSRSFLMRCKEMGFWRRRQCIYLFIYLRIYFLHKLQTHLNCCCVSFCSFMNKESVEFVWMQFQRWTKMKPGVKSTIHYHFMQKTNARKRHLLKIKSHTGFVQIFGLKLKHFPIIYRSYLISAGCALHSTWCGSCRKPYFRCSL